MDPEHETGGLRERKKLRRREALHEAALTLIRDQGYEATTVDQICEAVGVSPRTFFNYFPTKAAAALGLPEAVVAPAAVEAFLAARGELVPAVCELMVASLQAGLNPLRVKELVRDRPELRPFFAQWMTQVRQEFTELVTRRAGSVETAEAAIALVFSAVALLVHDPALGGEGPSSEALLATIDRLCEARHAPLV